jgi:hypothetical protein
MVSLPSISEDRTYNSEADFEEQEYDRRRAEKAALLAAAIFCAENLRKRKCKAPTRKKSAERKRNRKKAVDILMEGVNDGYLKDEYRVSKESLLKLHSLLKPDLQGNIGYVSLALGLKGVQSTVVDPRESVGKLQKKDRKLWSRVLCGIPITDNVLLCQLVVPYESLRDTEFHHADLESVLVCGDDHELVVNCSAIMALHLDEATDVIVDMAVQRRVLFVIVPCCVFPRLFPDQQKPNTDLPVTTYLELIDYLTSKHESIRSIQQTTLPFEGANVALWSIFQ